MTTPYTALRVSVGFQEMGDCLLACRDRGPCIKLLANTLAITENYSVCHWRTRLNSFNILTEYKLIRAYALKATQFEILLASLLDSMTASRIRVKCFTSMSSSFASNAKSVLLGLFPLDRFFTNSSTLLLRVLLEVGVNP